MILFVTLLHAKVLQPLIKVVQEYSHPRDRHLFRGDLFQWDRSFVQIRYLKCVFRYVTLRVRHSVTDLMEEEQQKHAVMTCSIRL